MRLFHRFFALKGWVPFDFQEACFLRFSEGGSGILNAPTGSGKTLALWLPCLAGHAHQPQAENTRRGLRVLWITPLRALTKDTQLAMEDAVACLGLPWAVAARTGDTPLADREKLKKSLPECLITTPESLHLMLAQKGCEKLFGQLDALIVDEWHELLGTKRGVQLELALSRLRTLAPGFKVWGISATIGNLAEAAAVLMPHLPAEKRHIVKAAANKTTHVETLLPDEVARFPWYGQLGLKMLPKILPIVAQSQTTLLFANTRAMAELWYQRVLETAPWLIGLTALHHGSLDRDTRNWVETATKEGRLKLVICTSSLDLGVDFHPVETVIQVGSPKGLARFLQRAGRSGHRPGQPSRIYFLPSNTLELVEGAALRHAAQGVSDGSQSQLQTESRTPLTACFDVLVQYLVTLAVSGGFVPDALFPEIKSTHCFAGIGKADWQWCLDFITTGGGSLGAYDEYKKVEVEDGVYKVLSRKVAMRHRLSIGTIVSEPSVKVKFMSGGYIGTVEENFIARLSAGDVFWFSGRCLEFVRFKDMTALVKKSTKRKAAVPRWAGARMPLSSELSALIREKLQNHEHAPDPEVIKARPMLDLQKTCSHIPRKNELLIERFKSKEGWHLFFYPFEGRLVHEVMAAVTGYRLAQMVPASFSFAMNDYGFELLANTALPLEHALENGLFSTENLLFDIEHSLNNSEMARRRFREIAAIAGLVFQGYPGKNKAARHLQASTQLLFNVFAEYDPGNLLVRQAFKEVLDVQLEQKRLITALEKTSQLNIVIRDVPFPTPFAFPIMVDRLRDQISTESLEDRVAKMQLQLEMDANGL